MRELCVPLHTPGIEGAGSRVGASPSSTEAGNTAEVEGGDDKRLPESLFLKKICYLFFKIKRR